MTAQIDGVLIQIDDGKLLGHATTLLVYSEQAAVEFDTWNCPLIGENGHVGFRGHARLIYYRRTSHARSCSVLRLQAIDKQGNGRLRGHQENDRHLSGGAGTRGV